MATRSKRTGVGLGLVFLMISGGWARAAEPGAAVTPLRAAEHRTADVEDSPPPSLAAVDPFAFSGADYYAAVGRPDLAESYEKRQVLRYGSRIVGVVAMTAGAVIYWNETTADGYACILPNYPGTQPCTPSKDKTYWGPDILMAAGLAMEILPALWSNDPVSDEEKAALARPRATWAPTSLNIKGAPLPAAGGGLPAGGTIVLSGRY
jgi:hypothetical protein